jgi:hypothetical protein
MDTSSIEGFVGVDVAQTGQSRLIQQQRLNLPAASSDVLDEHLRRDLQGFWSKLSDLRMCFQLSRFDYL